MTISTSASRVVGLSQITMPSRASETVGREMTTLVRSEPGTWRMADRSPDRVMTTPTASAVTAFSARIAP